MVYGDSNDWFYKDGLLAHVVPFRRPVYEKVFRHFGL